LLGLAFEHGSTLDLRLFLSFRCLVFELGEMSVQGYGDGFWGGDDVSEFRLGLPRIDERFFDDGIELILGFGGCRFISQIICLTPSCPRLEGAP
jgi:hypothetical protein